MSWGEEDAWRAGSADVSGAGQGGRRRHGSGAGQSGEESAVRDGRLRPDAAGQVEADGGPARDDPGMDRGGGEEREMTESEWWQTCAVPGLMLPYLGRRTSERRLRLFGCACCRRVWHLLRDA